MVYAVVKLGKDETDLRYVGDPCTSFEEARELICARLHGDFEMRYQEHGSLTYVTAWDGDHCVADYVVSEIFWGLNCDEELVFLDPEPDYDECGFNPYEGCYDYDC